VFVVYFVIHLVRKILDIPSYAGWSELVWGGGAKSSEKLLYHAASQLRRPRL